MPLKGDKKVKTGEGCKSDTMSEDNETGLPDEDQAGPHVNTMS